MSTASEIGRIPASWIRRAIHLGLGRSARTPVTVRATKIGQAAASEADRISVLDRLGHGAGHRVGEG